MNLDVVATELSPAVRIVESVWKGSGTSRKKSPPNPALPWCKLNNSLLQALNLAILSQARFDFGDFDYIYKQFRGEYWMSDGERFYAIAARENNLGATRSFEHWKGREPFILQGQRLYVGRDFFLVDVSKIFEVRCTSFSRDGSYLTATHYKDKTGVVDRRFKVHHSNLGEYRKRERDQPLPSMAPPFFGMSRSYPSRVLPRD